MGKPYMERPEMGEKELRIYVQSKLKAGNMIMMKHDVYNTDHPGSKKSERLILGFYEHHALTMDEYGRHETYGYHELFNMLKQIEEGETNEQT